MIERHYFCDVCKKDYSSAGTASRDLTGFDFVQSGYPTGLSVRSLETATFHLCRECLIAIVDLARKSLPEVDKRTACLS